MAATIIALCNQKGGVGKTTTTFQLARAAIRSQHRVLIVDLDPQGNATSVAAAEPVEEGQAGLADALSKQAPETIRDVIVAGVWDGLDVVPTSGLTLGVVRDELTIAGAGREVRLRKSLDEVTDDYDLIIIDCGPSLDQLTINGLTAAHGVVVVTQTKQLSLNGLGQLLDTVDQVREYYNSGLRVAGILINHHEERTVSGAGWLAEVHTAAESRNIAVFEPPIPKRVVISDATEASVGVDEWGSADATALGELYAQHLSAIERALS